MSLKSEYRIRIAIVGGNLVGKSNLRLRYIDDEFKERTPLHVSPDFAQKLTRIGNKNVKFDLWTMPGHDRFWKMAKMCSEAYKLDGIVMVYDVSNKSSFDDLSKWKDWVIAQKKEMPVMIVGNKIDLVKEFSIRTFDDFRLSAENYMTTSAKTGKNVKEVFELMAHKILVTKNIIKLPSTKLKMSSVTICKSHHLTPYSQVTGPFCLTSI